MVVQFGLAMMPLWSLMSFRVHAEEARVVHDNSAVFDGDRSKFLGNCGTSGAEHQVDTLEGILVQDFALEGFALELEFLACTAFRGEELQALQREISLFEDGEDFLAHGAGCAHNGYVANHN